MALNSIETPIRINGRHTWVDIFYSLDDDIRIVSILIDGERQDIENWKESTLAQAYSAIERRIRAQDDESRAQDRYEAVCLESGRVMRWN